MSQMTKQQALDALYTVLVDGISSDDISFTEEEHTQAVLAWNYFNKQGSGERNRLLATVDELVNSYVGEPTPYEPTAPIEYAKEFAELLKARMTESPSNQ